MAIKRLYIDVETGETLFQDIISDEEIKALSIDKVSQITPDARLQWLDWDLNAVHNNARQCMDAIVLKHSDRQPQKISRQEKLTIVREAKVETAREREERMLRELVEEGKL